MASLGRVAYVNRGAYNASSIYEKYDVVSYNNGSYAYINNIAASNIIPTTETHWAVMLDPAEINQVISATRYVHIKYAPNEPTENADMTDTIKNWIGIYIGTSLTAPTNYSDYQWKSLLGEGIHVLGSFSLESELPVSGNTGDAYLI